MGVPAEADNPALAYAYCVVLLAEVDERPAGVVVGRVGGGPAEVKRFWTDPVMRRRGVGGALIDAGLELAGRRTRLSVWRWRDAAIRLYESRGSTRVPSWDGRDGLVRMARDDDTVPLR